MISFRKMSLSRNAGRTLINVEDGMLTEECVE